MAESRADQGSFGWTVEAPESSPELHAPSGRKAPTPPKAKASEIRRRLPAPRTTIAKAGEAELPPDNELWDVHAAARFLKRSVSWVYHRAEDGTLPVRRIAGWGIRFIPRELRAWVEGAAVPERGE
jgi:predicted DNA-binding transcriptional regulator AlpA